LPVILNYTEFDALASLRGLILTITPDIEVILAQSNRVPEPNGADFVLMTVIMRNRLSTNVDTVQDTIFAGAIAGTVLTYDPPTLGDLRPGAQVWGMPAIVDGTSIISIDSTTTATITPSQIAPHGDLFAGYKTARQATELHVQLDVHGPVSGDNVQKLSTLLRDEYATAHFDASGLDLMALYAGDPRQIPFINGEAQWEKRWVLDVALQANQIVQVPQQFADELHTSGPGGVGSGLIDVDVVYPP
jgi:hypothetical protein